MVPVFDVSGVVLKSDAVVSDDLKQELRRAAASLENVPDGEKDWHPRSDDKVLDLVHPSLCPLVFGRSRIVSDRLITLDNCLEACGAGEVIPPPDLGPPRRSAYYSRPETTTDIWSNRFQWLPCEVDISGESPKIVSYINNLHPEHHRDLYGVVEKFIEKSLPLWDFIYRWPHEEFTRTRTRKRITCTSVSKVCQAADPGSTYCGCEPEDRPLGPDEPPRLPEREWWRLADNHPLKAKDLEWYNRTHPCPQPEPTPFSELPEINSANFRKEKFFDIGKQKGGAKRSARRAAASQEQEPVQRIQVIVKLANIHLTPSKPTYAGGSWHVEGQLNERICATALYYYDSANITPSHLAFRTTANEEDLSLELSHEQNDYHSIGGTFAIDSEGNTLQDLGRTATPEGRLLAFPNVYQHRVAPFELADKTKPGHRKILALFLVDPHVPVISTANVAPQQEEWWFDNNVDPREGKNNRIARLPRELQYMVRKEMDWVFSREEAKELRLELMDERTRMDEVVDGIVREAEWNFCEH